MRTHATGFKGALKSAAIVSLVSQFQRESAFFMDAAPQQRFSGRITVFQEKRLPEPATLAGYAALIDTYEQAVPLPRTLSATGEKHRVLEQEGWRIPPPPCA